MSSSFRLSQAQRDAGRKPIVTLDNVRKVFGPPGSRQFQALSTLSGEIASGEFLAVVGPSGCGKSTLMSIVAGLQKPSEGAVRIGETLVTKPYVDLGIVFQKDLLLPWRTALDNVLLQAEVRGIPRKSRMKRAHDLLRLVGLAGFESYYPHQLSGGMRQRVGICRALLNDPPLLLMDEPFAALDSLTRDQLALDFETLWQEERRTVLFITHNISEAVFLADRVLVMTARPGRVADIIEIDLPRPRPMSMRDAPEFIAYTGHVRRIFETQGVLREHNFAPSIGRPAA